MSKNGGMGSKRIGSMTSKGMGKCEAGTHAEQCGNSRKVLKRNKQWVSKEKEIKHVHADIFIQHQDDE